ncbi:MAG: 50S ribosomal protein L23 [Desulfarculales bacterium]|jgi:large subunit ribosomal protein L23|nr:50S ribosomal protein L23 [Desulfarculales bacterium]
MNNLRNIIKRPLLTEKSTVLREQFNQVVFEVDRRSNKIEICQAVEKIFGVKVLDVRTVNFEGKRRRAGRLKVKRNDWKKAYITLAPGQKLEIFENA